MPVYLWVKSPASSNDAIDPNVNWQELQSPATVNNSARGMMAEIAKYRDDTAGTLVTGGTSAAYTLTTNSVYTATPSDGTCLTFIAHVANTLGGGGTTTLAVDGGTAFPIYASATGLPVPASALVQFTPYTVSFRASSSGWLLVGGVGASFYGSAVIPIGAILPFAGSTAPTNFLFCAGQNPGNGATTYASLYAVIGTTYGGTGTSDFKLPDLRGRVIAGQDNMGGVAASRITSQLTDSGTITGTTIGSTGGSQNHTVATNEVGTHGHGDSISFSGTAADHSHTFQFNQFSVGGGGASIVNDINTTVSSPFRTVSTTTSGALALTLNKTGSVTNFTNSAAMAMLQPTIIIPYIIRVL